MAENLDSIGILTRREIEARIAGPLIKAFAEEFGKEKTLEVAHNVVTTLAKESGATFAGLLGGNSLEDFGNGMALWGQDDALQFDILERNGSKISMNVTRCRYSEMYKELGMPDLGYLLSCGRDFAMVEGFNPQITLTRTQTIMEGADFCDFRFELTENRE